jgi:hypothetical protein
MKLRQPVCLYAIRDLKIFLLNKRAPAKIFMNSPSTEKSEAKIFLTSKKDLINSYVTTLVVQI